MNKTITGRIWTTYEAYESDADGKTKIVLEVKTDSGIIELYKYLDENINFKDTIYYKLDYYTPVTITYHEDTITAKRATGYDNDNNFVYEEYELQYNKIDSIEITGNGCEDLVRDRKISDKLISEIKDIIAPVNGSLTKEEDKLVVKLPVEDKIYTMEIYEPNNGGYRYFDVGYDYLQPWGNTQDNSDSVVKYEVQEAVDYILKNH